MRRLSGRNALTLLAAATIALAFFFYSTGSPRLLSTTADNALAPSSGHHWPGWPGIKHMLVFGDSYTATGFSIKRAQPSIQNPMGNPPYPGRTTANGPTWIGFLTTTYNASFVKTVNFAMAGATVDKTLIAQYSDVVHSFKDQVNTYYVPNYSQGTADFDWRPDDTLFAAWFGINDVKNSCKAGSASWALEQDIDEYAALLDTLYQSGGRNFLLLNVPAYDRSPALAGFSEEAIGELRAYLSAFNVNITRIVTNLTDTYPDARTFIFDTNTLYHQVLDRPCSHPETCDLQDLTTNCAEYSKNMESWYATNPSCQYSVDQYFWCNSMHPGFRIHNATAKGIAAQLSKSMR